MVDSIRTDCLYSGETIRNGTIGDDGQWNIELQDSDLNGIVQPNSDGAFVYNYNKTDNSGYYISATLVLRQPTVCAYYDNSDTTAGPHHYGNCSTISINISNGDHVFSYGEDQNNLINVTDNYSVKYNTTIMTTENGSYTFILKWDDSWNLTFDGLQRIDLTSSDDRVSNVNASFTADLEANTYYPTSIEFQKYTGNSILQLYWIRPGQSTEEIVPQENLWFDHYYGGKRLDLNVTCPAGYSLGEVEGEIFCHKTWGDGFRIEDEQWDDSNTNNGDGCNSNWVVEEGFICTGGSAIVSDKWIRCPVGYKSYNKFSQCKPENDKFTIIFYFTIVIFWIGMIKYFIKDYIRVYKLDKQNKYNRYLMQDEQQDEQMNNRIIENMKDKNHIEFHR